MSFLKSIILGSEGSYNIGGIELEFEKSPSNRVELPPLNPIVYLINRCGNSAIFRFVTMEYLHVTVHEAGHAVARKLLTGQDSIITIFTDRGEGQTQANNIEIPKAKLSVINAAGPLTSVAFSACQLVAAAALSSYVPWPATWALSGGALYWMSWELLYAYDSIAHKDGDFGKIAKRDKIHLSMATTALICECAMGILTAKFWST